MLHSVLRRVTPHPQILPNSVILQVSAQSPTYTNIEAPRLYNSDRAKSSTITFRMEDTHKAVACTHSCAACTHSCHWVSGA